MWSRLWGGELSCVGVAAFSIPILLCAHHVYADAVCRVDTVEGRFVQGGTVEIQGWAVDTATGQSLADFRIEIDNKTFGMVTRNVPRPDVVRVLNLPADRTPGWRGQASLAGLSAGVHDLAVIAISASGERVTCAQQQLSVLPADQRVAVNKEPSGSAGTIALATLTRTVILLAVLALIGAPVAFGITGKASTLGAPIFGLALFAVGAEFGRLLKVSPLHVGLALVAASMAILGVLWKIGRVKLGRVRPTLLVVLGPTALFAIVGVIPFSAHGRGAVLGSIDDAARECMVAESVRLYRWSLPRDVRGMFRMMPDQWEVRHNRLGGPYLLASAADAFGLRAHEVHSTVMLAAGCLIVLGVTWLARLVFPAAPRAWLAAGGLAATNGTIVATLYGQHLGSLFLATSALGFAACCLCLRGRRLIASIGVGVVSAGLLTLYPEGMVVLPAIGCLSLLTVRSLRRTSKQLVGLFMGALLVGALNPLALAKTAQQANSLAHAQDLTTESQRMTVGDTFYFPSLQVLSGLEPYRLDGPFYFPPAIRSAHDAIGLAIIVVLAFYLRRIIRIRWRLLLFLLVPVACALLVNRLLRFPYGFAKFLPVAASFVSVALLIPLQSHLSRAAPTRTRGRHRAAEKPSRVPLVAGTLLVLLRLPPVYLVVRDGVLTKPAFEPAFAEVGELASAVGRLAVIRLDPRLPLARRQWICYFMGDNGFEVDPMAVNYPGAEYYRLIDLRGYALEPKHVSVRGTNFALEYLGRASGVDALGGVGAGFGDGLERLATSDPTPPVPRECDAAARANSLGEDLPNDDESFASVRWRCQKRGRREGAECPVSSAVRRASLCRT